MKDALGHGSDSQGGPAAHQTGVEKVGILGLYASHYSVAEQKQGYPKQYELRHDPNTGKKKPYEIWTNYISGGRQHMASFKSHEAAHKTALKYGGTKL